MDKLDARARGAILEIANRCAVMPVFLFDGLIPFMPEYDLGIDFILYREEDDLLIKVQQKGRWSIDRRYEHRDIGMLFPDGRSDNRGWYLVPHAEMMRYARDRTNYLNTASWQAGTYSTSRLNAQQRDYFSAYKLRDGGVKANEAIYGHFS